MASNMRRVLRPRLLAFVSMCCMTLCVCIGGQLLHMLCALAAYESTREHLAPVGGMC